MQDILIGMGVIFALGAIVFAIVHTARQQNLAKRKVFQTYAELNGCSYDEKDPSAAQAASAGFQGFSVFSHPAHGAIIPDDVVRGNSPEGPVTVFRHGVMRTEGDSREWYVCIVGENAANGPFVEVAPRRGRFGGRALTSAARVAFPEDAAFDHAFEVSSSDEAFARVTLNSELRTGALQRAQELPFKLGFQIVGGRVAAYPAGRNDELDDAEQVAALVATTCELARVTSFP